MSKSKKNVVDPDDIIESYGADTARWFMLSNSPPDRDVIWTEAGVEGAHRFVQRVWRLVAETAPLLDVEARPASDGEAGAVSRAAHRTVKAVGEDIDRLAFNKAVARLYELVNTIQGPAAKLAKGEASEPELAGALRDAFEKLVVMIAPMMPHLAEECWAALGGAGFVADRAWPGFEAHLTVDNDVTYPVQVNGKKRGELTIARDADQAAVEQAVLALDAGSQGPRRAGAAQGDRRAAKDRECRCLSGRPRGQCHSSSWSCCWPPRAPCGRSIPTAPRWAPPRA